MKPPALHLRAVCGPARMLRAARAFTLIELLTVIAIIGILAAIIIPVVGKVKQSALRSECVSNLRQLGNACALYATDNKGFYPRPFFVDVYDNNKWKWWREVVTTGGYLGRPNAPIGSKQTTVMTQDQWMPYHYTFMTCKAHRQAVPLTDPVARRSLEPTYSGNGTIASIAPPGIPGRTWRPRLEDFPTPSKLAYLADGPVAANGDDINGAFWENSTKPDANKAHNGVANILFFDGHIEARTADKIPKDRYESDEASLFWTGR